MLRSLAVGCLLLILPVGAAQAEDAAHLIAKHRIAQGGAAKIAAMRSLRLVGRIAFGGGDWSVELKWSSVLARPGRLREDLSIQGLTEIITHDGRQGWTFDPFQGRREPERLTADDAKLLAYRADPEGILLGAEADGFRIEALGLEDVDGSPAHKLKIFREGSDFEYVFLDPATHLIVRSELHAFVRGSETIEETDYGNFEQVAGVWIPFAVESGSPGAPRWQRRIVERAEANPRLDDRWFELPKPGAAVPPMGVPDEDAPGQVRPGSSVAPLARGEALEPRFDSAVVSGLGARNIGPAAMSGRIAAVAARVEGGRTTIYVGAASGGVWKSVDGGTTMKPVFDRNPVQSIGAIAIDPSTPSTVWVGTGESWARNSVSIGDGIYKSTDGGETWSHMGLRASERIAKIVVHPTNSEVVYACVPGRLFSDSLERGVYKTTDGGRSWTLILHGSNLSTGCSAISLDPRNPDVLLAGLWDFRRTGWSFRSGGSGPEAPSGSGLFQSLDGGRTWSELLSATHRGLPEKPWGRLEVVHAPSDGRVVYALIESKDSALYYSSDGGQTWEARDKSRGMVWRPFYFARLVVDPRNAQRLFKGCGNLIVSEDGGKSFAITTGSSHGDWHDLWIDPTNTQHVIGGDDGGLWISWDGGSLWQRAKNLPISQFYHVSVDREDPYHVYGGLQDNNTWFGETEYPGGVANERWDSLFWGDGFWTLVDPTDPNGIYLEAQGGYITRVDRKTKAARDIQPTAGLGEKLRFNWNTPMHLSPNERGTLYVGTQYLFRTRDRGDSWERISPDLTTNDPDKQRQEESGGVTVDNSSAETHTTIYTISESPKNGQVIWVGTDDGNLQLTRDGGRHWTNVVANVPGLPPASWVSWVEASRFDPATAYAAFDRHMLGDFAPYVYRTRDYGKTWERLAGPAQGVRGYAHVIREDLVARQLLFLGTELGLWISGDGGQRWAEFKGGQFPSVAVRDLVVQPSTHDLVLGTHGRGIWIVDDITPLRALSDQVLAKNGALLPSQPVQQRMETVGGVSGDDGDFVGRNRLFGAVVTYYQRERQIFGPHRLEILDPSGKVIDTIVGSKRRGLNRATWSMRMPPPVAPRGAQIAPSASQGPRVLPGSYSVRLTSGSQVTTQRFEIGLDRRAPYGLADRKAQFDAAMKVHALFGRMTSVVDRIDASGRAGAALMERFRQDGALHQRLTRFEAKLETVRRKVLATKVGGAVTGEERLRERADILYGALMLWEGRPARYQLERIAVLDKELTDVEAELEGIFRDEVPALNAELRRRQAPPIPTQIASRDPWQPKSSDLLRATGMFFGRKVAAPQTRKSRKRY